MAQRQLAEAGAGVAATAGAVAAIGAVAAATGAAVAAGVMRLRRRPACGVVGGQRLIRGPAGAKTGAEIGRAHV